MRAVALVFCVGAVAFAERRVRSVTGLHARAVRSLEDAVSAFEAADDLLADALGVIGEWTVAR